ncbi:hypothetical protein C8F01DRAFT_1145087 [Mycena amicta]|nr:hypothetical protein C8F01DRAFT_1145087 [Mycena amicta]
MSTSAFILPDTIPEIDGRVQALYAEITALKTKRNALVPIFKIPNEILCRIIELYAHASGRRSLFDLKWTKIILVCRRWYELALAEQRLWSYVEANGRDKMYTQLERSGVAPLHMKVSLYDGIFWGEWTMTHASRIVSLKLGGEGKHIAEFIGTLPNHPLIQLRSLTIEGYHKPEDLPDGMRMALPDELFDGRLPELRALSLSSVALPWHLVKDLEHLKLSSCGNSASADDSPCSVGDLLRLLARSPRLQTLWLSSRHTLSPIVDSDPVDLPLLQYLYIRDSVVPITALLHAIHAPSSTAIQLAAFGIRNGTQVRDVLVPLRARLRAATAPRMHHLILQTFQRDPVLSPTSITLTVELTTVWTPARISHLPDAKGKLPSLILNSHPETGPALRQIITKFLRAAPTEHVTHLDMTVAEGLSEVSWREILKLMPAVELIRVAAQELTKNVHSMTGLLDALRKVNPSPPVKVIEIYILRSWGTEQRDEQASWLTSAVTALEAYVRVRRAQYNANLSTPLTLIQIDDEMGHLYILRHHRVMKRIFMLMRGMGTITRGGREWDPIASREHHKGQIIKWRAMGIELPESDETESDEDVEPET